MDQKVQFVARYLEGEKIAVLCREFEISRVTGHKIITRYQNHGIEGIIEQSRRPYRQANKLPFQIESLIVSLKKKRPTWGAVKIREKLIRKHSSLKHPPAKSTVHAVLVRNGLVKKRTRNKKYKASGTFLSNPKMPNDLWCVDYKGEFMLGNKKYCYPLTVTDYHSRFLIACDALETTKESYAMTVFDQIFQEYGLPKAIRSDNGVPFSTPNALYGLSKLSVWWLRLGIRLERIKPGNPQQNGRHERMHLTLKKEACRPAATNFLSQQARFDRFIQDYNFERPHQGIDLKYPSELFTNSSQPYKGLPEISYPMHDMTLRVTKCGRICTKRLKISLSKVLAGQDVGIKEVSEKLWLVSFMDYDLGYFDEESKRVEPINNPFDYKL